MLFSRSAISIHALRAERDFVFCPRRVKTQKNFNPRAPSGARHSIASQTVAEADFNPRAPSGARHLVLLAQSLVGKISIHALRAERDHYDISNGHLIIDISIHALRAERDNRIDGYDWDLIAISIHALRAERDKRTNNSTQQRQKYFNPRAPSGARQLWM